MLEAVALGEAGQVEPVPAPALAVVRAGQQPIDELVVGVGRRIGDERLDLLRRRRQADQVEVRAANQLAAIGGRVRRNALRFQPRQDEAIDRRAAPGFVLATVRQSGPCQRLERPELAVAVGHRFAVMRGGRVDQRLVVGAPLSIQAGDPRDRRLGQLVGSSAACAALRRAGSAGRGRLSAGLADHDGRPLLAALEQPLAGREVELALGLLAAVAFEAVLRPAVRARRPLNSSRPRAICAAWSAGNFIGPKRPCRER